MDEKRAKDFIDNNGHLPVDELSDGLANYARNNKAMKEEIQTPEEAINLIIRSGILKHPELVSDGYHDFKTLYAHRIELFISLCRTTNTLAHSSIGCDHNIWRSLKNDKGEQEKGWFLMGIDSEPGNQISYHLPYDKWEQTNFAKTLEQAPEFDGHNSEQVLERLSKL